MSKEERESETENRRSGSRSGTLIPFEGEQAQGNSPRKSATSSGSAGPRVEAPMREGTWSPAEEGNRRIGPRYYLLKNLRGQGQKKSGCGGVTGGHAHFGAKRMQEVHLRE